MTKILGNGFIKQQLAVIMAIIGMTLLACNTNSSNSDHHDTAHGQLQVRMHWQPQSAPAATRPVAPSSNVCVDFEINWIRIQIKDPSGQVVANSSLVPCADRRIRLNNIPARTGYQVEVEGLIDNQVQWHGTKENVTVTAGQSTESVMVTMNFIGETPKLPTAEIAPAHKSVNVPTDSAVTIQFNKPMVPASINEQSIQITCGNSPVAGSLTYSPETAQAVFQPDEALAVSTDCGVIVTTDVMDPSGQSLPKKLSSQFTTTMAWYVDGQIPKSGTGKDWKEAFGTIAEAVAAAGNGHHIWVKQGTYQPGAEIVIDKPVVLLGGFEGTETQHHQRDWKSRQTVVDGKDEHRCFLLTADADIDGFTITGGAQKDLQDPGNAMRIAKSSPRITNCIFVGNSTILTGINNIATGAVYIRDGDPVITGCTFKENSVISNGLSSGGAISNYRGGPTISDCIFKDNWVKAKEIDAADIIANSGQGGAIYNNNGKVTTVVKNCLFDGNSALCDAEYYSFGGAIHNYSGAMTISHCRFSNNNAQGSGGAVYNSKSDINIHNTKFYANTASSATISDGRFRLSDGGAISNSGTTASIINCTFSLNKVIIPPSADKEHTKGGAIANKDDSNVTIVNSIMWDNWAATDSEIYDEKKTGTTVSYSCIKSGDYPGEYNIESNPRLNGDLHLRFDSPCRGKADSSVAPKTDIDGDSRPTDTPSDMGVDQFVDSDDDQLPDYWEKAYYVDASDGDEDHDGLTNLEEYHLSTDPTKAQSVNAAKLYGNFNHDGEHRASDFSTIIGNNFMDFAMCYRSFFAFKLSNPNPIKGGVLRLYLTNGVINSGDFQAWDVTTTNADSFSTDTSGQAGIDIYDDLGQGIRYSKNSVLVGPTANDDYILWIHLNAAAVAAVNTAIANSGEFIVGVRMSEEYDRNFFSASESVDEKRVHQLILIE